MPIKYIPFIPEPIEGQAVLGNFSRILKYKGADEVSMTLQRGMPLYEMEKVETVGENADGNMVIRGECVSACAYLKEQGIQVQRFLFGLHHCIRFLLFVHIVAILIYLRMLNNKLATDTRIEVALNQSEVLEPMSEFFAFASFGVTYRMSFCCK